jgi:hypothetical protein
MISVFSVIWVKLLFSSWVYNGQFRRGVESGRWRKIRATANTGGAPLDLSDVVLICIEFVKLNFQGSREAKGGQVLCPLWTTDLDYCSKVCLFISLLAGVMRA